MSKPKPAIFLDRDGVINRDTGYTHKVEELEILPGVIEGCWQLQQAGYKLVIVTNQSGIARGIYSEADYQNFTKQLLHQLAEENILFDGVYFCPHHKEGEIDKYAKDCQCRKPSPGMLQQAAKELGLELSTSYIIGDRPSDLQAGKNAGLRAQILIATGKPLTEDGMSQASFVADNFLTATEWILTTSK